MRDYYQEMRDACAKIVITASELGKNDLYSVDMEDILAMAKWVSLDRDEALEASKQAVAKGIGDAFTKMVKEEL